MTREEKFNWMAVWCAKNGFQLELKGECGFGRECVGIVAEDKYPDYHWYDTNPWKQLDNNGDVFVPENAYHKHECVAVLGRGEEAEDQLYQWLKWFDENNFKLEVGDVPEKRHDPISVLLGQHRYARLVKQSA